MMASVTQAGHSHRPASPTRPRKIRYPLRIIFPREARIAVIGGRWRRLSDGRIECRYHNHQELALSITLSLWLKEWETEPSSAARFQGTQLALFESERPGDQK